MELMKQKCEVCTVETPKLSEDEIDELMMEVPQWKLVDEKIERKFRLDDFRDAIDFVNEVADLAEKEGHHPDIYISYNKVQLVFWTHKIGGLSHNDFIMAAKVDKLAPHT